MKKTDAKVRKKKPTKPAKPPRIGASEPLGISPLVASDTRSLTVKSGVAPPVQTALLIHGIGNKPEASILKCQWDTALFDVDMGDRTRMAYWVNRERYPRPLAEDCAASVSGAGR